MSDQDLKIKRKTKNPFLIPSLIGGFLFTVVAVAGVFFYLPSVNNAEANSEKNSEIVVEEGELHVGKSGDAKNNNVSTENLEIEDVTPESDNSPANLQSNSQADQGQAVNYNTNSAVSVTETAEEKVSSDNVNQSNSTVPENNSNAVESKNKDSETQEEEQLNTGPVAGKDQSFTLDVDSGVVSLNFTFSATDADDDVLKHDYAIFKNGTQVSMDSVASINKNLIIGHNTLQFNATEADFGNQYTIKHIVSDEKESAVQNVNVKVTKPVILADITSPSNGEALKAGQIAEFRSTSTFVSSIVNGQVIRSSILNTSLGKDCSACANWAFEDFQWTIKNSSGQLVSGPRFGTIVSETLSEPGSYTAVFKIVSPETGQAVVTRTVSFSVQ
jgi:hypothetical protein